jgi:hypothetical protein
VRPTRRGRAELFPAILSKVEIAKARVPAEHRLDLLGSNVRPPSSSPRREAVSTRTMAPSSASRFVGHDCSAPNLQPLT